MTPDQVKEFVTAALDATREVEVIEKKRPTPLSGLRYTGNVTFVGENTFRLDTSFAACFFYFDEVQEVV